MITQKIISSILAWRFRHMSHRHFVMILSAILGLFVGLFAVFVKFSIHYSYDFVHKITDGSGRSLLFLLPIVGIGISVFLSKKIFQERIDHGVSTILLHISKKSSKIKKRMSLSYVVSAIATIAFGGSVGLEAPLVVSGSAIGSNFGRMMRLHYKSRTLLIGCGTAAAISGIFNSPIAGVIFAIEIILAEVSIEKFVPILISSVCASIIPMLFQQHEALFNFQLMQGVVSSDIPYFIGFGVVCGLVSLYFTRTHYYIEGKLSAINNSVTRVIVGGGLLSIIIFLFPPLYGEGYATIRALIEGNEEFVLNDSMLFADMNKTLAVGLVLFLMIFVKAFASACTVGAGGSGGIFAPSLMTGGLTGYMFARSINQLDVSHNLSSSNFALVGMCGVVAGVQHAPLTGIFLIAEITGGYTLFLPLMIVSAISFVTMSFFEPHSIYTKRLIEKGDLIQGNKDKEILSLIDKKRLISKSEIILRPEDKLSKILESIKDSHKMVFPVVDQEGFLVGIVNWSDIKGVIFDKAKSEEIRINTIMHTEKIVLRTTNSVQEIMNKFEKSYKWSLPILDEEGKYKGVIYKDSLYKSYRDRLIKQYKKEV